MITSISRSIVALMRMNGINAVNATPTQMTIQYLHALLVMGRQKLIMIMMKFPATNTTAVLVWNATLMEIKIKMMV